MTSRILFFLATPLLVSQTACGCDAYAAPSLTIQAVDAQTRAPVVTQNARVIVSEGAFADTSSTLPGGNVFERTGTYRVVIETAGYRRWEQGGLRVGHDGCHVKTLRFTALLEPAS